MTDSAKTDVGNERANLPPLPWDWTASGAPSNNGAYHAYLVDATGRKIAAIWGKGNEKAAIGDTILTAVNSHDALVKALANLIEAIAFAQNSSSLNGLVTIPRQVIAATILDDARAALSSAKEQV